MQSLPEEARESGRPITLGYLENHQSYFEKLQKNLKMTPLIVENEFPKKIKSKVFNL